MIDRHFDMDQFQTTLTWNLLDSIKPSKSGLYLVLRSEPYSKNESIGLEMFWETTGYFDNQVSGANEIVYWAEIDEFPELTEYQKTRLVIR